MLKLMIMIDYLSTRLSTVLGASVSRWPRHDPPEVWAGLQMLRFYQVAETAQAWFAPPCPL